MVNYAFGPDDHPADWFKDYSVRDWEIVDYQYYVMPGLPGVKFRGPQVPPEDLPVCRDA